MKFSLGLAATIVATVVAQEARICPDLAVDKCYHDNLLNVEPAFGKVPRCWRLSPIIEPSLGLGKPHWICNWAVDHKCGPEFIDLNNLPTECVKPNKKVVCRNKKTSQLIPNSL